MLVTDSLKYRIHNKFEMYNFKVVVAQDFSGNDYLLFIWQFSHYKAGDEKTERIMIAAVYKKKKFKYLYVIEDFSYSLSEITNMSEEIIGSELISAKYITSLVRHHFPSHKQPNDMRIKNSLFNLELFMNLDVSDVPFYKCYYLHQDSIDIYK